MCAVVVRIQVMEQCLASTPISQGFVGRQSASTSAHNAFATRGRTRVGSVVRPRTRRLETRIPPRVHRSRHESRRRYYDTSRLDDYDDDGLNVFYLVSITFAIGIWFVFYRYQSMRNRAVPFRVRAPEVRLGLLVMSTST